MSFVVQSDKFSSLINLLRRNGWEGMDWIDLAQGQVAGYCENNDGLLGFIKCGEMCE
jgi:hypothetical protein